MPWCLKCHAKNAVEATVCAACGEPVPPSSPGFVRLARWWRSWRYVIGLLAAVGGGIAWYASRGGDDVDEGLARREAIAAELERRLEGHGVFVSRGTVLVITGACEPGEIAAIQEAMPRFSAAGFTGVECGSRTIPVR